MKLLLHACCGPCSLEPVRLLKEQGCEFAIDYTNPNIEPRDEYEHRLETIRSFVIEPEELEFFADDYDNSEWEKRVAIHGKNREARCRACYRLRFERVAERAVEEGFDAIGTTLTISPYQLTDVILEELERAAAKHGIASAGEDYHLCYREATRRSRDLGMYRQDYCGCRFSIAEAEETRALIREQRKRAKQAKHRALMQLAAEGGVNQENQL